MTSMSPVRVLFIDVDGTLVGPDGVHDRVWPAIARARAAGWRVAICTGRPGRGLALDYATRADADGLHVFESGAAVVATDGRVAWSATLPSATVETALALAATHPTITPEAYMADGRYFAATRNDAIARHEALLGFDALIGPIPTEGLVRIQLVTPNALWPQVDATITALPDTSIHVGRSPKMPDVAFVAVTAPGISKAAGIDAVLSALGADAARAAMIGDQLNDLPALRLVGTGFVVEDGASEALALATHVVPSAADGGVADAIEILLSEA